MIKLDEVRFDCKFFRGDIPCKPNKERSAICTCEEYTPITKKILIIKLGALGDVIRTTPLVSRYKSLYPNCHISWITLSPNILPKRQIDTIYGYDFTSVNIILNSQYDIAVNLDKEPEACMLLRDVKAAQKHGFSWFDDHIIPVDEKATHKLLTGLFDQLSIANTKSYPEEIFEICGMEFEHDEYLLDVVGEFDVKWRLILSEKANGKKIIGLNTGCGPRWATRLWPATYWLSLIDKLKNQGFYPVVLGGPAEEAGNIYYQEQTGAYYPGTFSLQEFIAISNNCDVIVSAVSMMMHLAVGLKKNLVLFNNIFNRHEFDLYGRGFIVEPETGCDCFYGNSCKRDKPCMEDLPVEKVFNAVTVLAERDREISV